MCKHWLAGFAEESIVKVWNCWIGLKSSLNQIRIHDKRLDWGCENRMQRDRYLLPPCWYFVAAQCAAHKLTLFTPCPGISYETRLNWTNNKEINVWGWPGVFRGLIGSYMDIGVLYGLVVVLEGSTGCYMKVCFIKKKYIIIARTAGELIGENKPKSVFPPNFLCCIHIPKLMYLPKDICLQ